MAVGIAFTAAMAALGTSMAALGLAVKGASTLIGGGLAVAKLSVQWTKSLVKTFSGLDLSLKNLGKTFEASIAAADQLQKRNLALGRDFQGFSKGFGGQIDKLPGVLSERLGTTMSMVEAGLRGNTLRTRQLTQTVRMSGGNFKQLSKDLATTQTDLALNNTALESLSVATMLARDKYGVAAEQMVGAIGKLNATVKRNAVLSDTGGPLSQAMINLSGRLGGRAGGALARVVELGMLGETFGEAHILGVQDQRRGIQSGDAGEIEAALLEMIQVGGARAAEIYARLGVETGIAGDSMGRISPRADALRIVFEALNVEQTALMKSMSKQRDFHKQLSEIGKAIWEPIQKMWLDGANGLYAKLLENAELIQKAFTTFVVKPLEIIIAKFTTLFLNNEDFLEGLKSIFVGIATLLGGVASFLDNHFTEGGDSIYTKIIDGFGTVVKTVGSWFNNVVYDFLPKLEIGFFSMIEAILVALGKVTDIDKEALDVVRSRKEELLLDRQVKAMEDPLTNKYDLKMDDKDDIAAFLNMYAWDKSEGKTMGTGGSNVGMFNEMPTRADWSLLGNEEGFGYRDAVNFDRAIRNHPIANDAMTGKSGDPWVQAGDSGYNMLHEDQRTFGWGGLQKGGEGLHGEASQMDALTRGLKHLVTSPWTGETRETKTSGAVDYWKMRKEVQAIKDAFLSEAVEGILKRDGKREETWDEKSEAWMKTLKGEGKKRDEGKTDYGAIFDDIVAKLDGIKTNTEVEDEVPEILSNMVDEQAAMLSDSITAILMNAQTEELLRVQLELWNAADDGNRLTQRQIALQEDAALVPLNGSR